MNSRLDTIQATVLLVKLKHSKVMSWKRLTKLQTIIHSY